MRLILASTSPTRARMLADAGLEFEVEGPRIDENEVKAALRAEGVAPRDQSDLLAEMKAVRVSAKRSGVLVIGADQVLDSSGQVLDKPRDMADARSQLARLRGNRHNLFSAAVVALDGEPIWRHVARVRMEMRAISDEFLESYLEAEGEAVLSTVGGYRIEGRGVQLFSRIEGDFFAVLGLPLLELLNWLRARGELPA